MTYIEWETVFTARADRDFLLDIDNDKLRQKVVEMRKMAREAWIENGGPDPQKEYGYKF